MYVLVVNRINYWVFIDFDIVRVIRFGEVFISWVVLVWFNLIVDFLFI